jgi:Skp family chaperone for outer membrane proteins
MTTRKVLFIVAILIGFTSVAQKPQRIGYIDMEYILQNIPEYQEADARLKNKIAGWQQKLDDIKREIEVMKTDLANEKPLLTDALIKEREEDIQIREEDHRKLQAAYFGPTGDQYLLRKQLVKPIQDQVYNAVQDIAVNKNYDMILDKSSDLIMLYTNDRFDVSDLVLSSIVKGYKKKEVEERKTERQEQIEAKAEALQEKVDDKEKKRQELEARVKAQQEERAKLREEQKKAAEEKRQQRLKEIEDRKKSLTKKVEETKASADSTTIKVNDSIVKVSKDSIQDAKRQAMLDKIKAQQEAKAKLREEQKKAAEEKRKQRLEEIEKRKKMQQEQKENNNN